MSYKTQHSKFNIEQHEPHEKPVMNVCVHKRWEVHSPLVVPIVLLLVTCCSYLGDYYPLISCYILYKLDCTSSLYLRSNSLRSFCIMICRGVNIMVLVLVHLVYTSCIACPSIYSFSDFFFSIFKLLQLLLT
jgi:hypothetical protein